MTRRTVRVDAQFFTELDAQLGEARGPNGEPSASDFLLIELPILAEAFAERFDDLLRLYPARDDYRYLVAGGRLVYAVVVVGQRTDDDSILLFGIEIDLHGPQEPPDNRRPPDPAHTRISGEVLDAGPVIG